MSSVGHYEVTITAAKNGNSTSETVTVEYAPDYNAYTASVHRLDYARMQNEPNHKASYKCPGTVAEILQAEPYVIAKLKTDSGDLLFEYHGTAASVSMDDNKTYTLWGDYNGVDAETGLPKVYCWFITKK
jgi:hypothetical protein